MERRSFFKSTLIATGSILFGGATLHRFMNNNNEIAENNQLPQTIEKTTRKSDKKNVLVLMSAGTRHGNTDQLTDAYIRGVEEKGHSVTKVYLGNIKIEGCRGCGVCQRNSHQCAIKDDMQDLYPSFDECDTIVMASPLYFWAITARLKSYIERLYAISEDDEYPQKEIVFLMTAGEDKETTFDHPKRYYKLMCEVFGDNGKGAYFAGGCTGCEDLVRKIDKKHLDNAYKMGLEL